MPRPILYPLRTVALSALLASTAHTAFAQTAPATEAANATVPAKISAATGDAPATPGTTANDEKILVTAQRRNQVLVRSGGQLGALGNVKGLDAPFNIRSYSSSLIVNQQSETLGQVLQNDPSVRTTFGYGNFSELFVIRGFALNGDDVAIDGLYGITPRQLVSPELYDQVQVINGASAFLFGAAPSGSGIGGSVNLVPKIAEAAPLTRLTGNYTSGSIGGGNLDVSRRFGQDHAFGFRLNVAGHSGDAAINHEHRDATAISGAFDWHDDKTRISMNIAYQQQDVDWGRGAVFLGATATSVPRAPSPSSNYGQPWTYTHLNDVFGMLNIEHDLMKDVTLYAKFGSLGDQERGNYGTTTIANSATGDGTVGALYVPYNQNNESVQAGLRAKVRLGPVMNQFNMGGNGLWEDTRTAYALGLTAPAVNIYQHNYVAAPAETYVGGNLANPKTISFTRLHSIFFSDTASFFDNRASIIAGFRYQNIMTNGYDYTYVRNAHYNQSAISPVVGVVLHPVRQMSIYFNRIEGLAQGPTASGNVTNVGEVFPPYRSVQYEIGSKYETAHYSASISLYQIAQPNAYATSVGNSTAMVYSVNGQQRNRGIEAMFEGEIIHGLRVNGGATLIQADQRHTAGGAQDGKTAIGVPNYTINANVEYDLPFMKGATVTGRVVHTGKQWVNATNTLHIGEWTTFDLGARYTFDAWHTPVTGRFGVDNVANERYWSSAFGGYLYEGLPRTFKLSFTADF